VLDQYIEAVNWLFQGNTVRFRRAGKARRGDASRGRKAVAGNCRLYGSSRAAYAPEELSQVFDGYFQTFDQAQKLEGQRRSPISDYLDKFDR